MKNPFISLLMKKLDPEKDRAKAGKRSGILGIVCNILLFAGKLLAGLLAGSVSIMADAMNNLTDATSSVVTLLGFRLAEKPADEDHPYGHARFEYLSGLAVAALIILIGFELGKSSFEKILHPSPVTFTWLTVTILAVSMVVKLALWRFNQSLGETIRSTALTATAQDSRNDAIATGAVLLAGVIEKIAGVPIDGFMGMAVAIFILYSGAMLAKDTISPLLGEGADPELREKIVDYIRKQPKVLGFHDLMVHDYGPGQRFATLHVEMDNREDPLTCHELIDDMERECLKTHGIHLVIHYDPVVMDDPELNRLRACCEKLLQEKDTRLHLHDFRMVRGTGHTNLIFDVALPDELRGWETDLTNYLQETLTEQEGIAIYTVITFDPEAFNLPAAE
ncbi:MAG: cation transporter [Ruminococcaceae bacterium]|nr:cation transporter [Oscillospiraceae bacterium]